MSPGLRAAWVAAVLATVSCTRTPPTPFGPALFTPAYYEVESPPPSAPTCAGLSGVTVVERRSEPLVVGRRFQESEPSRRFAIKASTEPAKWVQAGLAEAFQKATLPANVAGRGKLQANLMTLDLTAVTAFNSIKISPMVFLLMRPTRFDRIDTYLAQGYQREYPAAMVLTSMPLRLPSKICNKSAVTMIFLLTSTTR